MIDYHIKKTKNLIIATFSVLIVLGIILFSILNRSYVDFKVTPPNAIVKINNAPVSLDSSGEARVKTRPDVVSVKVEAEGYVGNSQIITLGRGKTFKYTIELKRNPIAVTDEIGLTPNSKVSFVSEADEDNSVFYLSDNGSALYKAKFDLNSDQKINLVFNHKISNPNLSGINDIIWSPDKGAALFKKNDGVYFFDLKKYNLLGQEEVKYGEDIGDIAWSPDDSKIAYYYAPPSGEKTLIFADKTNSEKTKVANFLEMGIDNPYLCWSPDSEWLVVIPRNKDFSSNKIYLFNTYTRDFSTVSDSGNNVEAIFSLDSNKIFYTNYQPDPSNPVKSTLNIMDKDGKDKKSLGARALLSKISLLSSKEDDIIISTYNPEKQRDSLFIYNLVEKRDSGFKINLPEKQYINEIISLKNSNLIFYLSNNKLYALNLK